MLTVFHCGLVGLWCLMPFSTIFELYHGGQFYWWRKLEKTTDLFCCKLSHWQTLSHNVVSNTPHHEWGTVWTHNFSGDLHWLQRSCKSNYHTFMTAPCSTVILQVSNVSAVFKTRTRSKTINYTGKKKSGAGMDTWKERNVSYIRDENKFTNNVFI